MNRILVLCVGMAVGVGMVVPARSQESVSKVGTTAAPFLEIPVGARAMAMGNAFVGTADDITSLYWNPAGLARLLSGEAVFNHAYWIADMRFDYAAVGVPLSDFGSLGISFTQLSMDDQPVRTVERPEGTGEQFGAGSYAIGLHYARTLLDWFAIGFTVKYIDEHIWHMKSQAFALDVGTLFTTEFLNGLRIGASVTNFGTEMQLAGSDARTFHPVDPTVYGSNQRIPQNIEMDSWDLPMNFQIGIAADVIKSDDHLLTLAIDALHPSDNHESVNLGAEYGFRRILFLRGGYQSLFLIDGEGGLSLGAGVLAPLFGEDLKARFDYAYTNYGRLNAVHVFAVGLLF